MKMHYFNLFLLHFTIESELPCGPDGITSLIAGAVRMQPAIWRCTHVQCANSEARGSCDNATKEEGEEKEETMMMIKKTTIKSRGGEGSRRSDGGRRRRGREGRERGAERSSSVKHVTRMERTNRHSVLRPRYTANMAAEGRIGGGQPRRQPMSS